MRNRRDTLAFILKLRRATTGKFQLSTDGWPSYPEAVERVFGADIHYAQLVKVYAASRDGEQRYSPAEVVDVEVVPRIGMPDYERICASHVERQNLTMRMHLRRLTRVANAQRSNRPLISLGLQFSRESGDSARFTSEPNVRAGSRSSRTHPIAGRPGRACPSRSKRQSVRPGLRAR